MKNPERLSSYTSTYPQFGSSGYDSHLLLVTDTYRRMGFIGMQDEVLADAHDTAEASYCLLHPHAMAGHVAGTFRIVPGTYGLPLLSAFPNLAIEGISSQMCESTRMVSARTDSGGSVLFETVIRSVAYVRAQGLLAVVSLGSPRIFERINSVFSDTQRALAAPCAYRGGIVVPSIIWVEEFELSMKCMSEHIPERYSDAVVSWKNR